MLPQPLARSEATARDAAHRVPTKEGQPAWMASDWPAPRRSAAAAGAAQSRL